jgi:hypothetical protein
LKQGKVAPTPDDPKSWESENWETKSKFLFNSCALTQEAFRNRTHPRLYEAFRTIFNKDELLVKIDKWGVMRPTFVEGKEREDWRWELSPHWDCNPHRYNDEVKQGKPRMYQVSYLGIIKY